MLYDAGGGIEKRLQAQGERVPELDDCETACRTFPAAGGRGEGPLWTAIGIYALCFAVMVWPWLLGRVTIPWDATAHFQPQIQFLADCLARGEWPFWNPYVFSGHPQIADPQSMIFSPPFLLLALLNRAPSLWAVDVTLLAVMFASGVCLMVWFHDRRWHWCGGLIAALAFSFGAVMAWRIQHIGEVLSLAYLPLALVCLDRTLERQSVAYGAATGIASALIVIGRDQVALLCVYLLAGYTVWRLWTFADMHRGLARRLAALALGGVIALVLAAVPVTLTALLAAHSNRPEIGYIPAGRGSLHPALLLTYLMPDVFGQSGTTGDFWGPPSFTWLGTDLFTAQNVGELYVGAIPFLLCLGALVSGRLWAREIRFFTVALVLALLYAVGWYTPVFRILYALVPGVDLYRRPADAVFVIGGLTAILAGYALHRLFVVRGSGFSRSEIGTTAAIVLACVASAFVPALQLDHVDRLWQPLGFAAIFLGGGALLLGLASTMRVPLAAGLTLAGFTAVDLAWNNGPNSSSAMPPSKFEVLDPNTRNATIAFLKQSATDDATRRDRVELAGLGFHWPNASMTHRLENTLGYNPIRLGLYSRATGAEDHVGLPDQRRFVPLMPSYRSRLADLLGLRYIATGVPIEEIDTKLKHGELPLVARTPDAYIYENANALPRVLFAREARKADFAELLNTGAWPDFDPRTTVLLEGEERPAQKRRDGRIAIRSHRNTEIVIEAESPDGGWVVLNDVWQPWWLASIDDRPARMLRANVLFRAVEVPPGKHTVRFEFRPLRGAWRQLFGRG